MSPSLGSTKSHGAYSKRKIRVRKTTKYYSDILGYVSISRRIVISTYQQNPLKYGAQAYPRRGICSVWGGRALDRSRPFLKQQYLYQKREYGMLVVKALRSVLKIRYLLLGGAVAGGGALQKVIKVL